MLCRLPRGGQDLVDRSDVRRCGTAVDVHNARIAVDDESASPLQNFQRGPTDTTSGTQHPNKPFRGERCVSTDGEALNFSGAFEFTLGIAETVEGDAALCA